MKRIVFDILGYLFNLDVHSGVQTTLFCALDPELCSQTGQYYSNCAKDRFLFRESTNVSSATDLWNLSLKLVGIDDYFEI